MNLRDQLARSGLSASSIEGAAAGFEASIASLDTGGHDASMALWWVPGRVEVFGKHTDYAGGRSLLCAIERGFHVASRPRHEHPIEGL